MKLYYLQIYKIRTILKKQGENSNIYMDKLTFRH